MHKETLMWWLETRPCVFSLLHTWCQVSHTARHTITTTNPNRHTHQDSTQPWRAAERQREIMDWNRKGQLWATSSEEMDSCMLGKKRERERERCTLSDGERQREGVLKGSGYYMEGLPPWRGKNALQHLTSILHRVGCMGSTNTHTCKHTCSEQE